MSKPLLSVIVPCAPGRKERVAAILSRLTLNKAVFPDHTFEVLIADGGSTDDTIDLCRTLAQYINLKYVYLPIGRFINAAYPRNVLLRMCEGQIIAMIDIDHFPGENIVFGMLNPFIDDSNFKVIINKDIGTVENRLEYLNGQVTKNKPSNIINRGYVVDSSKSSLCACMFDPKAEIINKSIISMANIGNKILHTYSHFKIPHGINNTLWTWAVKRENVLNMGAYDEIYVRGFRYRCEDDSIRERFLAQGLRFYDGQNKNFCSIHLYHPAECRSNPLNEDNKRYFDKIECPVKQIDRNINFKWGKLLKDSFSIINGETRNTMEHEKWILENVKDAPSYVDDFEWSSIDNFMKNLEDYYVSGH